MASPGRWLRLPRPRKFIYFMSLRTGVEIISLSMLFNKVACFYGLLALLTGFKLDAMQLSMYIYSVLSLILTAFLMAYIRKQSVMECLALAWFYTLDSVINSAYTVAFALTWFMTISASSTDTKSGIPSSAPGSGMIGDSAGFTSPPYNVSQVDVNASPAASLVAGQDAVAIGTAASAVAATENTSLQHGVQQAENILSLVIIVLLTLIRIYFVLIVMAYARQILRQYMQTVSAAREHLHTDGTSDAQAENPFAANMPLGQGWRGILGRMMVRAGNGYFLGDPEDDEWAKGVNRRFKKTTLIVGDERRPTFERERKASSGTGTSRSSSDPGKA